jgi:hypothetical protein
MLFEKLKEVVTHKHVSRRKSTKKLNEDTKNEIHLFGPLLYRSQRRSNNLYNTVFRKKTKVL